MENINPDIGYADGVIHHGSWRYKPMRKLKTQIHGVPSAKSPNPSEHWEQHYNSDPRKDTVKRIGAEFDARPSKSRMTTHVKVNECDH